MRKPVICAFFLMVHVASSGVAWASACCGGGHGLGQRLGPMERGAVGVSLRDSPRFGSFGPSSRFSPIPAGSMDNEVRADLSLLFAPIRRVQLGLALPFLLNLRRFGEQSAWGGGLSDVSASFRVDLIPLSSPNGLPSIALTTSVLFPTGRPLNQDAGALGEGATGLGVGELRPGIFIEKTWEGKATAVIAGSVGFRTPSMGSLGESIQLGPRARFLAALGPVFSSGMSFSLGLVFEMEPAPTFSGIAAVDGDRRRTALLGFFGYDLSPRFTLLGSFEVDLPVSQLSKNEPSAVAISLGLRRAFSWKD